MRGDGCAGPTLGLMCHPDRKYRTTSKKRTRGSVFVLALICQTTSLAIGMLCKGDTYSMSSSGWLMKSVTLSSIDRGSRTKVGSVTLCKSMSFLNWLMMPIRMLRELSSNTSVQSGSPPSVFAFPRPSMISEKSRELERKERREKSAEIGKKKRGSQENKQDPLMIIKGINDRHMLFPKKIFSAPG